MQHTHTVLACFPFLNSSPWLGPTLFKVSVHDVHPFWQQHRQHLTNLEWLKVPAWGSMRMWAYSLNKPFFFTVWTCSTSWLTFRPVFSGMWMESSRMFDPDDRGRFFRGRSPDWSSSWALSNEADPELRLRDSEFRLAVDVFRFLTVSSSLSLVGGDMSSSSHFSFSQSSWLCFSCTVSLELTESKSLMRWSVSLEKDWVAELHEPRLDVLAGNLGAMK